MANFDPAGLINTIKPESLRVHAPSVVVFLCGGAIDKNQTPPLFLRDAFLRGIEGMPLGFKIILAEDAKPLTTEAGYADLFQFESDIAQIVGLILLFAESPGSLAELGAFAALKEVAPRILAVLDDFYYNIVSFIRNGPVAYLENRYGEEWITVLERGYVGISEGNSLENLNSEILLSSILPIVEKRLSANNKWTKFDFKNSGHVILLMTGLCQEYGALTQTEIRGYLKKLGVDDTRFSNLIYCAELLGWVKKIRKGNHIFYAASQGESAIDYAVNTEGKAHDKVRWRIEVRAHWAAHDTTRIRAINEARSHKGTAK